MVIETVNFLGDRQGWDAVLSCLQGSPQCSGGSYAGSYILAKINS